MIPCLRGVQCSLQPLASRSVLRRAQYGSDVVRTVLAHAFGGLDLQCVSLEVRSDNRRAITAYMRAGFRPEGVLR
ncbi:MAG: GNAT family N-acetyltransferase, partial [Chloroflexi bacterium]|nr:GNAT family N-acetyltransferase [Chloroflexota bacterium]